MPRGIGRALRIAEYSNKRNGHLGGRASHYSFAWRERDPRNDEARSGEARSGRDPLLAARARLHSPSPEILPPKAQRPRSRRAACPSTDTRHWRTALPDDPYAERFTCSDNFSVALGPRFRAARFIARLIFSRCSTVRVYFPRFDMVGAEHTHARGKLVTRMDNDLAKAALDKIEELKAKLAEAEARLANAESTTKSKDSGGKEIGLIKARKLPNSGKPLAPGPDIGAEISKAYEARKGQ